MTRRLLVVADIASPVTVRNLRNNPSACGQLRGCFPSDGLQARRPGRSDSTRGQPLRNTGAAPFLPFTRGHFRIRHVLHLAVSASAPIIRAELSTVSRTKAFRT